MRIEKKIIENLPRYGRIYLKELALSTKLALKGVSHQYQEVRALRSFLHEFEVDCVFDVGANHGQYASMLRHEVGYKGFILSFEPAPEVFVSLGKRSSHDDKWQAFHLALSDHNGSAPFYIMAGDQASSLNAPVADMPVHFSKICQVTETADVPLRKLDDMFGELQSQYGFKRPYLKLDTQGHDRFVAEGAAACLPDMLGVQTELAIEPIYQQATDYRTMIAWLEEHGFLPSAFFANNRGHFPLVYEMDGIFVNKKLLK
jgi:FkbM family methyltransferase